MEKKAKILVVDDEQAVCEGVGEILSAAGFDVKTAFTGEDALQIVEDCELDLILMDLILPGMDGAEACERIRALRPGARIVAISGSPSGQRMEKLVQSGDVDFCLYKPFGKDGLLEGVRRALEKGAR